MSLAFVPKGESQWVLGGVSAPWTGGRAGLLPGVPWKASTVTGPAEVCEETCKGPEEGPGAISGCLGGAVRVRQGGLSCWTLPLLDQGCSLRTPPTAANRGVPCLLY